MRAVLAIAATVWFFGASFGLLARSSGLGILAPLVMSATTFAGSAQFAIASILGTSGGTAAAIAAAGLLDARHVPISISLAPLLRRPPPPPPAGGPPILGQAWGVLARRRRPLR